VKDGVDETQDNRILVEPSVVTGRSERGEREAEEGWGGWQSKSDQDEARVSSATEVGGEDEAGGGQEQEGGGEEGEGEGEGKREE
jgi:hypothetical protein